LNDSVNTNDIDKAIKELKTGTNKLYYDASKKSTTGDERDVGEIIDVLSWINPKHLQSIPDIDHAHILCLRGTSK